MKILHVAPSFYPALIYGGPTYSTYGLCRGLLHQHCQVRVLTTDANGPHEVLDVNTRAEVELFRGLLVRYCHRVKDVSVSPALLRYLASSVQWADVVHLMAVYSFPTIPTLLACRLAHKPVVWSPRGMLQRWHGTRRPHLKSVWEKVCQLVSPPQLLLHATSEEEAERSQRRLPGVRTVVVPNGVDIPDDVSLIDCDKEFRLVYLGRLHPQKGIENLLSAYKRVNQNLELRSSLIIGGTGEKQYIEKLKLLIVQLDLSGQVTMMGHVAGADKEKLLEGASVVVVPSHVENFAVVVAEALAHGVPVIASRGTPWRRIEEVGCGLWVENDPESLAGAIKQISVMPLQDMGLRGRAWMRKEFGWDVIAGKMVRVYQDLVPNAR